MRSRNLEEDMTKTSLAFGSGWMTLGCIDPINNSNDNNNNNNNRGI